MIIVDEFTGRTMPGRRWSDGLHQAVEAKEALPIQNESVTLASISYQNFFRWGRGVLLLQLGVLPLLEVGHVGAGASAGLGTLVRAGQAWRGALRWEQGGRAPAQRL